MPAHTTVGKGVARGNSDTLAPCESHGQPFYDEVPTSVPKMLGYIASARAGQPASGGGAEAEYGLAFQKLFLEGDERWRSLLLSAGAQTNIQ